LATIKLNAAGVAWIIGNQSWECRHELDNETLGEAG
jgi:hypothetical protein